MAISEHSVRRDDWDRHWTDFSEAVLYNPAHDYRRWLILTHLGLSDAKSMRVLDIGCGQGDFLIEVHRLYPKVQMLGLEYSKSGVDIGASRLPEAKFMQRDLVAGDEGADGYEAFATHAVCSEVLEHVDDPVLLLQNARAYMADGCRLVVTVPGGPRSKLDIHIGHRRHFTPVELEEVLRKADFTVELASGAGFPFFNLYRCLVILRGNRLVQDASHPTALLKSVSAVFKLLFKANITASSLGWQTFAVARK